MAAFFNDELPGANAQYLGPDNAWKPTCWWFEMPGAGKRLAIEERVYEAWPSHKELLERVCKHWGLLEELRNAGPGDYRFVREGEKVKMIV